MNNTRTTVVDFLKARLSEAQVPAGEGSFLASPLFRSILCGDAKFPLNRVEEVAGILACDVRQLFRMAMRQFYNEETIFLLEKMLAASLTEAEQKWLHEIRLAADGPVAEPSGMAKRLVRALVRAQDAE